MKNLVLLCISIISMSCKKDIEKPRIKPKPAAVEVLPLSKSLQLIDSKVPTGHYRFMVRITPRKEVYIPTQQWTAGRKVGAQSGAALGAYTGAANLWGVGTYQYVLSVRRADEVQLTDSVGTKVVTYRLGADKAYDFQIEIYYTPERPDLYKVVLWQLQFFDKKMKTETVVDLKDPGFTSDFLLIR